MIPVIATPTGIPAVKSLKKAEIENLTVETLGLPTSASVMYAPADEPDYVFEKFKENECPSTYTITGWKMGNREYTSVELVNFW